LIELASELVLDHSWIGGGGSRLLVVSWRVVVRSCGGRFTRNGEAVRVLPRALIGRSGCGGIAVHRHAHAFMSCNLVKRGDKPVGILLTDGTEDFPAVGGHDDVRRPFIDLEVFR
jgi:hypothetical protein